MKNIVIFGCSGAIGSAFVKHCARTMPNAHIHGISRTSNDFDLENVTAHLIEDYTEDHIKKYADTIGTIDMVIVANGILCDGDIMPEKSLRDLSAEKFQRLFEVNTILPALIAKYFIPKLKKDAPAIFAALSARVGSISDNRMGGWYAYRASKTALNMILKNIAIETGRKNKNAIIIGLHPGTVNSNLSKPFQGNVPSEKLFTPDYSAEKLSKLLLALTPEETGKIFAWDGQEIYP